MSFFTSCKTHLSSGWEAFDTGRLGRLEHLSSMTRFMTSMGHFQGHFLEAKSEAYHSPNSAGDGFEAIERPDSVVVTKKWFLLLKRGVRLAPPTKWAVSPGQSSFHKPMS